jgi:hypothetical protein
VSEMRCLYVKIVPDADPNADGEWRVVPNLDLARAVLAAPSWDAKSKLLASVWLLGYDRKGAPIMMPNGEKRFGPYHVVAENFNGPGSEYTG